MPIFQDDDDDLAGHGRDTRFTKPSLDVATPQKRDISMRRGSEESIRTEFCEGPIHHSPEYPAREMQRAGSDASQRTSDRVEFMERLKRGESPTWVPNMRIEPLFQGREQCLSKNSKPDSSTSSPLLTSAQVQEGSRKASNVETDVSRLSSEIERPRSALHSGDFTEERRSKEEKEIEEDTRDSIDKSYISTPSSWMATSPPREFTPFQLDPRFPRASRPQESFQRHTRGPSLSSSLSTSFVLKAPTSPLVQFESNEDLDYGSSMDGIDIGAGLQKHSRRHTLQASHSINSTPTIPTLFNLSRPLPNLRRDNTFPYQAHQPRRSLTSNSSFQDEATIPNSPPFWRSRRPSYTSESSPLQHASMVGSYEESILRGRMSTTPSKPFDFVAKIGVLGRGKCKPYLRCPAHVTLPFPAVFYSYGTTSHGRMAESEDGPSPYVGQIDLENGITPKEKKHKRKAQVEKLKRGDHEMAEGNVKEENERARLPSVEEKNTSSSLRAPPGGSYRIPEKGQLQIIIKNPNNTAIKLFLVPYDLAGMVSGTKTFIRQRIYSAGPIIDAPLSSASTPTIPPTGRPILRYLIHLHICCPSKNRFYLYKTIRVVFANRVPDGKETLRSEIQLPEPRFSPYICKPAREPMGLTSSIATGGAGATLTADKAFRRRSGGIPLTDLANPVVLHRTGSEISNKIPERVKVSEEATSFTDGFGGNLNRESPTAPIPFALDFRRRVVTAIATSTNSQIGSDRSALSEVEILSPASQESSSNPYSNPHTTEWMKRHECRIAKGISAYDKLSKGDNGYGGYGQQSIPEGLLAKRLRNLGIVSGPASSSSRFTEGSSGSGTADDQET